MKLNPRFIFGDVLYQAREQNVRYFNSAESLSSILICQRNHRKFHLFPTRTQSGRGLASMSVDIDDRLRSGTCCNRLSEILDHDDATQFPARK